MPGVVCNFLAGQSVANPGLGDQMKNLQLLRLETKSKLELKKQRPNSNERQRVSLQPHRKKALRRGCRCSMVSSPRISSPAAGSDETFVVSVGSSRTRQQSWTSTDDDEDVQGNVVKYRRSAWTTSGLCKWGGSSAKSWRLPRIRRGEICSSRSVVYSDDSLEDLQAIDGIRPSGCWKKSKFLDEEQSSSSCSKCFGSNGEMSTNSCATQSRQRLHALEQELLVLKNKLQAKEMEILEELRSRDVDKSTACLKCNNGGSTASFRSGRTFEDPTSLSSTAATPVHSLLKYFHPARYGSPHSAFSEPKDGGHREDLSNGFVGPMLKLFDGSEGRPRHRPRPSSAKQDTLTSSFLKSKGYPDHFLEARRAWRRQVRAGATSGTSLGHDSTKGLGLYGRQILAIGDSSASESESSVKCASNRGSNRLGFPPSGCTGFFVPAKNRRPQTAPTIVRKSSGSWSSYRYAYGFGFLSRQSTSDGFDSPTLPSGINFLTDCSRKAKRLLLLSAGHRCHTCGSHSSHNRLPRLRTCNGSIGRYSSSLHSVEEGCRTMPEKMLMTLPLSKS